ncbi:MAG TPA: ATPase [Gammaproteobacteria bacterium]|nr:ATPase [Gammaproteobacteria bacterium]
MSDIIDLELIIESGISTVFIETADEERVITLFRRLSVRNGKALYRWTVATGLSRLEDDFPTRRQPQKLADVLSQISQATTAGIYLFLDSHPWMDDPLTIRLIRETAQHADHAHTLIFVGPEIVIPAELKSLSARFELSLPTLEQLAEIIHQESAAWGRKNRKSVKASRSVIDAMTQNLLGMTLSDARRLIRQAIYDDGILADDDIDELVEAKYRTLDSDAVLTFEMETAKFGDVAGLRHLKKWLQQRRAVFLADEAPAGLDSPKGILLLGVQGAGKSLAAKSIAGAWQLPLLRLDFAALYNKYYGETERNLRDALRTAETMEPCVLWIDEIEKGLSTDNEGGPSQRILGTLLTWMAERGSRVFLVATANDIEALPPELLRKGRFDEIFFVDLPRTDVRAEIFRIHLQKRDQEIEAVDLDRLSDASAGFSGAEIEQAVVASLYSAFAQQQPLTTQHILEEINKTRPLSVLMKEKIDYLRAWAAERTVMAD